MSVDEKTVQRAKRLSRKRGKSISKMVEEYLNRITEKEEEKEMTTEEKVRRLINDLEFQIKEARQEAAKLSSRSDILYALKQKLEDEVLEK